MIKQKLKICAGCGLEKIIFKNIKGAKYCQQCSYQITPPKHIRPRSLKRAKKDKIYSVKSTAHKDANPCCQARISPDCKGCDRAYATNQHLIGRVGDNYLNEDEWITVCFFCHVWINSHPKEAMELGLAKSRLN